MIPEKPGPKKLKQSGTIPCYKLVSNTVVPKIPTYLIWSELGGSSIHHALPALRTFFRTLQVTVVTEVTGVMEFNPTDIDSKVPFDNPVGDHAIQRLKRHFGCRMSSLRLDPSLVVWT